jgi:hypothetical protein
VNLGGDPVPEETKVLLRDIHEDMSGIRADLRRLASRLFWVRLAVVLLVIGLVFAGWSIWSTKRAIDKTNDTAAAVRSDSAAHNAREDAIAKCIATWANNYARRAHAVQTLATARVDKLFDALDAANRGHRARALNLFHKAQAADRRYHRYISKHPVPQLKLSCSVPPTPGPHPSSSSRSPTPSPSVSVRVVPGPTTTVPGPTVTVRPAPRTKVVTTTVPPGKARRRP